MAFRWSLCHFYEIIRLLLCFFSGLYFSPKHSGKNIRSASGFFIAGPLLQIIKIIMHTQTNTYTTKKKKEKINKIKKNKGRS
jgi:hypothetical protein